MMFDWLKQKKAIPATPVQTLEITPSLVSKVIITDPRFHRGMWVTTHNEGVGIIIDFIDSTTAQVGYVKEDGTNIMVLDKDDKAVPKRTAVPFTSMDRAKIKDIPESRKQCGVDALRAMGYGD